MRRFSKIPKKNISKSSQAHKTKNIKASTTNLKVEGSHCILFM